MIMYSVAEVSFLTIFFPLYARGYICLKLDAPSKGGRQWIHTFDSTLHCTNKSMIIKHFILLN